MHLHGHNFWVVAAGTGEWNGTVTRPRNPQRRDTQIIGPRLRTADGLAYVVLDFLADNPGIWPFHCHVAWHVSDGLYVNIMASCCYSREPRSGANCEIGTTGFDYEGKTGPIHYGADLQRLGRVQRS